MARAALNWTTSDLAKAAGIGINTVNRFEGGADTRLSSVEKLRRALERAGITFIAENGGGAGVRLAKSDRPVQRKARN
jgi:transcriptional regulator with XRE-family HTH domain